MAPAPAASTVEAPPPIHAPSVRRCCRHPPLALRFPGAAEAAVASASPLRVVVIGQPRITSIITPPCRCLHLSSIIVVEITESRMILASTTTTTAATTSPREDQRRRKTVAIMARSAAERRTTPIPAAARPPTTVVSNDMHRRAR